MLGKNVQSCSIFIVNILDLIYFTEKNLRVAMEHISVLICGHRTFVACCGVIERCSYVLRERGKYVCFLAWPQDMSVTSYVTTEHVFDMFYDPRTCL